MHNLTQNQSQPGLKTLIGKFLGRHTARFTGKPIQTKCYISYMISVKKFEWMSFPVKRPVKHLRKNSG